MQTIFIDKSRYFNKITQHLIKQLKSLNIWPYKIALEQLELRNFKAFISFYFLSVFEIL